MVRDQQLTSFDYLDLAASKVSAERDEELIEAILGNVQAAIARYVPDERREALGPPPLGGRMGGPERGRPPATSRSSGREP